MIDQFQPPFIKCICIGFVLSTSASIQMHAANEVDVDQTGPSMWGTTGLIAVSSPDMMNDGTLMAGGNYLPIDFFKDHASGWDYYKMVNSGNYYVNATFLPFWEIQLRFTLAKIHDKIKPHNDGKWNQDRSFSTKFKLLKEHGLYRPAIAVGMEDVAFNGWNANDFFKHFYISVGKHWDVKLGSLGAIANVILAHDYKVRPQVGLKFAPYAVHGLSAMVEYDGYGFNAGARWLLWNHISLMAATYHFNSMTAGVAFFIDLKK